MAISDHAIVIGAGIGGLAAAGALADHFKHVTIMERGRGANSQLPRTGAPQSSQLHYLLQGGLAALCEIFPHLDSELARSGAVPIWVGLDDRREYPGFDPYPQFDIGVKGYSMSRHFVERTIRNSVNRKSNVTVLDKCRVRSIVISEGFVTGVEWEDECGSRKTQRANLVVDASGRGALTLAALHGASYSRPVQTTVGVDVQCATAELELPAIPQDWKTVVTMPDFSENLRVGALLPIEGDRWMALLSEWHAETAVKDQASFLNVAQTLRTPTIYNSIRNAKFRSIKGFRFRDSYWRRFEHIAEYPEGLIPLGDAICRVNPIYGQGMSLAAKEALALKEILNRKALSNDPLTGVSKQFLQVASEIIAPAWSMSALPDLALPQSRGKRALDMRALLKRQSELRHAAAYDPLLYKRLHEVRHLVSSEVP
ncbi:MULTISPECIES: NAD(P)/FAD-dependent oxidoreductase [unclassified Phyllobacterium]|uniref:NAD(P)/FAD-dependent oxidoreductase n=1 Tax=unclassified Phyllobacterium TaxID=2638441 RepID=UPI003012FA70